MKRVLVAVVVLGMFSASARADQASREAKARELFTLLQIDKTLEQTEKQGRANVRAMLKTIEENPAFTDKEEVKLKKLEQDMLAIVSESLSWKSLEPEYVTLYAATYTDEELDGLLGFYRTPVGRSMLAKIPVLNQERLAISQRHSDTLVPRLRKMLEDFVASVQADSAPTAP